MEDLKYEIIKKNIVQGKLKKAEEFLIAAYWNFLK